MFSSVAKAPNKSTSTIYYFIIYSFFGSYYGSLWFCGSDYCGTDCWNVFVLWTWLDWKGDCDCDSITNWNKSYISWNYQNILTWNIIDLTWTLLNWKCICFKAEDEKWNEIISGSSVISGIDNRIPSTPVISGIVLSWNNITISWSNSSLFGDGCANISGYEIYIYDSGYHSNVVRSWVKSIGNNWWSIMEKWAVNVTSMTSNIELDDGIYSVKIRAQSDVGVIGDWSDSIEFTKWWNNGYIDDIDVDDPSVKSDCGNWDNDKFLDSTFWNMYDNLPYSLQWQYDYRRGAIICALYGSGQNDKTAYTKYWSGFIWWTSCDITGMNVVYVSTLPATLSGNTIYVLSSSSNWTGDKTLPKCTAVIWKSNTPHLL